MGFFKKSFSNPQFTKYAADHFHAGVKRILWENEKLIADGFFEDGPDPMGEEDVMKGFFGGSSHTYVAVTSWRIICGYLANGQFSSHEYVNTKPSVRQVGSAYYFTYTNPLLEAGGSPNCRSTYIVSSNVADSVNLNLNGKRPSSNEQTKLNLARKSWGEGPLADLAKAKSGRDYMPVEMCKECGSTNLVPDDIEQFPEKGNKECRTCLRVRSNI